MGDLHRSYREHFGRQESSGTRMTIRFNSSNGMLSSAGDIGSAERERIVEEFLGDRYDPTTREIPAKGKKVYYVEFQREGPYSPVTAHADMSVGLRDSILSAYLNQRKE